MAISYRLIRFAKGLLVTVMTFSVLFGAVPAAHADTLSISLASFATGLSSPIGISHSGMSGDDRIFVLERAGRIKVVQSNGSVVSTPFLDIDARVGSGAGEEGLLGLAFHPNYASNRQFYVYYTNNSGDIVISRFLRSIGDANVADDTSEQLVTVIGHPGFANHNGGQLQFSPNDGYLYAAVGDGGGGGDPNNQSQNKNSLLGKILRFDVNGDSYPSESHKNYAVPSGNPLVGKDGADEIWSIGLRNPWRFSFDRVLKHMWIGDVGQNAREEVNFEPSFSLGGKNFGWRCYEGSSSFNASGCASFGAYDPPAGEYDHSSGNCSVTGGYMYRGSQYPAMAGHYMFMDFCSAQLYTLTLLPNSVEKKLQTTLSGRNIASFGQDGNGELYAADITNGTVYKVQEGSTLSSLPVYRLAQPHLKERLFTTNIAERDEAVIRYGYVYEGVGFRSGLGSEPGTYPVYRLSHPVTSERLFTTNSVERDIAVSSHGYVYEGVALNGVPVGHSGAYPVYRLAHPGTHERLYTASTVERDQAVTFGYSFEGIGWYGTP